LTEPAPVNLSQRISSSGFCFLFWRIFILDIVYSLTSKTFFAIKEGAISMASEIMYWSDLRGKPVQLSGQGRKAGVVEDFYYDPETQSVAALRVKTTLYGSRALLTSAIAALDQDNVTIENENMLIDETNTGHLSLLPLGSLLIGARVLNEQGHELGTVSNLHLGVYPLVAMRISSFEMGRARARRISAHAITSIDGNTLTVIGQEETF
jgi:sporulation protein YlmC with PRC-barrel domain